MNQKYIDIIENLIDDYDMIVLLDDDSEDICNLKMKIFEVVHGRDSSQCLILGKRELRGAYSQYKVIDARQFDAMVKMYHTYEFTDHIRIITHDKKYGSMLNYLETGLLTEDEYIEALLH